MTEGERLNVFLGSSHLRDGKGSFEMGKARGLSLSHASHTHARTHARTHRARESSDASHSFLGITQKATAT